MANRIKKNQTNISKQTVISKSQSFDDCKIVWCFDSIDRNGKFAFDLERDDFKHKEFIEKVISYSTMTWDEIKKQTHDKAKSKNHNILIEDLSPDAIDRIRKLRLDEQIDSLFSIAFNNTLRIIGIRENEKFKVLWYDSNHEVCISHKKHT